MAKGVPEIKVKVLLEAIECQETFCLYESPFRVIATLQSIAEVAPQNQLIVCRELTKKFEETLRGTSAEVLETLEARSSIKGEFVIVVANPNIKKRASEE